MPIETSLPFPNPQQNLRVGWPSTANLQALGVFDQIGFADGLGGFANGIVSAAVWDGGAGVGGDGFVIHNGILCAGFGNPRQRGCLAASFLQVRDENLAPGYAGVEFSRVYRLTIQLAVDDVITALTGLQFSPADTLSPRFSSGGSAAFGVVGDGAGGWDYIQSDLGAFPGNVTDTVAIPASTIPDATDWNTFVFELINSAPGRDAIFTLTVNGISVVSRNWVAPLALPDYSERANSDRMLWGCIAGDAASDLFVGPLTIEMGRFTAAGLEILS